MLLTKTGLNCSILAAEVSIAKYSSNIEPITIFIFVENSNFYFCKLKFYSPILITHGWQMYEEADFYVSNATNATKLVLKNFSL